MAQNNPLEHDNILQAIKTRRKKQKISKANR